MKRQQLMQELGQAMMNMSNEQVLLHQAVSDTLGLNITDHKCVNLIARYGPMTAGKLAELTGLTTGAITGVIDRLEKAGYAKRVPDKEDRRVILVELTHKEVEIRKIFAPLRQKMQIIFDTLTDEELTFLLKFIISTVLASHEVTSQLRGKDEK